MQRYSGVEILLVTLDRDGVKALEYMDDIVITIHGNLYSIVRDEMQKALNLISKDRGKGAQDQPVKNSHSRIYPKKKT